MTQLILSVSGRTRPVRFPTQLYTLLCAEWTIRVGLLVLLGGRLRAGWRDRVLLPGDFSIRSMAYSSLSHLPQLTGHPSFDWFSPAVTSVDKELHGAMLALSHPSVALIGSLLANVPSSTPGADFTCLQILAFWLSWARKLYTGVCLRVIPVPFSHVLLRHRREAVACFSFIVVPPCDHRQANRRRGCNGS